MILQKKNNDLCILMQTTIVSMIIFSIGNYIRNQRLHDKEPMVTCIVTIGSSVCSLLGTKATKVSKKNQRSILYPTVSMKTLFLIFGSLSNSISLI